MPRYNYECVECGAFIELVHSMSTVKKDCIKCEAKNSLKKIFSIPNIGSIPKKQTGAAVKSAIEEYKQRIKEEKGAWDDFDVNSILEEKK